MSKAARRVATMESLTDQLLGSAHFAGATAFAPSLALAVWIVAPLSIAWARVRGAEVVRG